MEMILLIGGIKRKKHLTANGNKKIHFLLKVPKKHQLIDENNLNSEIMLIIRICGQ